MIRVLIADDEPPARRWLRELLSAHESIKIVAEAGDVAEAIALARKERPDLLFLDIQMPPGNGFDVLKALGPKPPKVVFVTAHDHFAIKAFETNAVDYLLKPVHPDRLAETLRRVGEPPASASPMDTVLPLRDGGRTHQIPLGEVVAIGADGAYTRVYLRSGAAPLLILQSIGEWTAQLPSPPFYRVDRSCLVNLSAIRTVEHHSRDETLLLLEGQPEPIRLGRAGTSRLRRLLKNNPLRH